MRKDFAVVATDSHDDRHAEIFDQKVEIPKFE
jgi:hypothetical protein